MPSLPSFKVTVHYFIQNDQWESINDPNSFELPMWYTKFNDVKAKAVYDNFPLRQYHNYYLRFYIDDSTQKIKGWFDYPPKASIPVYDNIVYVKALRIPMINTIPFKDNDFYEEQCHSKQKANKKQMENDDLLMMNDVKFLEYNGNTMEFVSSQIKTKEKNTNEMRSNKMMRDLKRKESRDDSDIFNLYQKKEHQKDLKEIFQRNWKRRESKDDLDLKILHNYKKSKDYFDERIYKKECKDYERLFKKDSVNEYNTEDNIKETSEEKDWFNLYTDKHKENKDDALKTNVFEFYADYKDNNISKEEGSNNKESGTFYSILEGVFSEKTTIQQQQQQSNSTIFEAYTNKKPSPFDSLSSTLSIDDLHNCIDIIIGEWSNSASDKNTKKNIICLLSSLSKVWTNDPYWETISTEELINNKSKLRSVYKQAMMQLHIDKNVYKDEKTKYIAKSLYQLINEAHSIYNNYS